jgi:hypothetical protein
MTSSVSFLKKLENQKITRNHSFKIIFCLIFVISIMSQGKFDPTPFNLMVPPDGLNNFFGLPGALLGGLLLDFFGKSAILLPVLFVVIKRSEQSDTKFIGLKIILFYLMLNCSMSTIFSSISASIAENFGILGLTAYQFIETSFNLTIGIVILVFFTSMYLFVNSRDLEIDRMIFYLLILSILAIGKSVQYFWKHAIGFSMKMIEQVTKSISKRSDLVFNRFYFFYQNQKKSLSQRIKLAPIQQKTKLQKKVKTSNKKQTVSKRTGAPLKFQSKTKQLLHQAIEVYQKTNYPGNDTTVKTLDN